MATRLGLEPCWGKLDARHLRGGAGNVAMRAGLRPTAKAVATPPDATAGAPALYPTSSDSVDDADALVVKLQDGLNTISGGTPKPGRGIVGVLKDRSWSFALVVGVGFVLLVSLAVSAWLTMLGTYFGYLLPLPTVLLGAINFAISLAVITGLFALTFKLLPDVKVAWRDVWLGAAVTSLLFSVGKLLIGLYLGKSGVASVFGAAGSLVVILVWVYYSAQILYLGAEFTKVWARWRGGGFAPDEKAVPVTAEARAEQGMRQKES